MKIEEKLAEMFYAHASEMADALQGSWELSSSTDTAQKMESAITERLQKYVPEASAAEVSMFLDSFSPDYTKLAAALQGAV
ncbi:MAG: hypothetical protein K5767_04730 [Clostridia bacterium]|nr:hypothetical protein [Clostridia bacterium]